MFLIFKKEFRELESVMSELRKKIKKSTKIEYSHKENTLKYSLDSIDLYFDMVEPTKFTVKDKSGDEILSIYWHSDSFDEMQQARNHQVSDLLTFIRDVKYKRVENERLKAASEEMKKAVEAEEKQKAAEKTKSKVLSNALNRLRGL